MSRCVVRRPVRLSYTWHGEGEPPEGLLRRGFAAALRKQPLGYDRAWWLAYADLLVRGEKWKYDVCWPLFAHDAVVLWVVLVLGGRWWAAVREGRTWEVGVAR